MIITRLSKQTNRSDRYNVYVDELYSFSISANDLLKSGMFSGKEISEKELEDFKRQASKRYLFDACLRYISSRPHSKNEVSQYIKRKIFQNKEIKEQIADDQKKISAEILDYLEEKKYINDEDFASWLVSQRNNSRSKKSFSHIKAELHKKGISNEIISNVLSELDSSDESAKAKTYAEKKFQQLKNKNKSQLEVKKALYQHLSQKGFSWEVVQSIVDTYTDHQYNYDQ